MNAFSSGWREQDSYPHMVKIDGCTMDQSHGWSRDSFHGRHGLPWGLVTPATPRFSNCFSLSGWRYYSSLWHFLGFPSGSAGKESACNVGHLDSIPGLGRSLGERKGYPLQYSGLENSMDCIVHGGAKSRTQLSNSQFTHWAFPKLQSLCINVCLHSDLICEVDLLMSECKYPDMECRHVLHLEPWPGGPVC